MASTEVHSGVGSASLLRRTVPIITLLIPSVISVLLVSTSSRRLVGSFRITIEDYRTTVSIVVQLLATILGLLQVTTLTGVIQSSYCLHFFHNPMQLDTIGLFNALAVLRIPWSLPSTSLLIALTVAMIAHGPGALWAGAITPFATSTVVNQGSVSVPQYTEATTDIWDSEFGMQGSDVWNYVQNCTTVRGDMTSVSNCPVPNYQAVLLDSARGASSSDGLRNHSKPNNPIWTYQGRSYGVGSSQGLVDVQGIPYDYKLLNYAYNETGFLTEVECKRNTSSALYFQLSQSVGLVDIWEVEGTLPNSIANESFPVMAWHRDSLDEATALAWVGVSNDDIHMIEIVASKMYGNFSQLQCTVKFTKTVFSISVDTTTNAIHVSPVKLGRPVAVDIDPTGHLQSNAMRSVNLLSRMTTSLYVSVLGEALDYNLNTVISSSNNTIGDVSNLVFRAASDSFIAVLDDVLGIYGGAQLVLSNASTQANITARLKAVQIGEPWYQWVVLGINMGLLALVLVEGVRTRWWRGLPCFDPLDFKSIVAASSFGGKSVANGLRRTYQDDGGNTWDGDPGDKKLGSLVVHLQRECHSTELAISLVGESKRQKYDYRRI